MTGAAQKRASYLLLWKPYGVICQFTEGRGGQKTLASYGPFPKDVYPAGRLDADSEGLVLLTNDGRLKHRLLEPRFDHPRTYLVQVEGIPSEKALHNLRSGVVIEGKRTRPAVVLPLPREPDLPPRTVPIRFRVTVPTSWLKISLREGRNRQVRKMTAAVGHPTLRLVRTAIGPLTLYGLRGPGETRSLDPAEIRSLLAAVGMPSDRTLNASRPLRRRRIS